MHKNQTKTQGNSARYTENEKKDLGEGRGLILQKGPMSLSQIAEGVLTFCRAENWHGVCEWTQRTRTAHVKNHTQNIDTWARFRRRLPALREQWLSSVRLPPELPFASCSSQETHPGPPRASSAHLFPQQCYSLLEITRAATILCYQKVHLRTLSRDKIPQACYIHPTMGPSLS